MRTADAKGEADVQTDKRPDPEVPPEDAVCLKCGYSLRGLLTPRCPECGRQFDPLDPRTFRTGRPSPARRDVTAAWLSLLIASVTAPVLRPSLGRWYFTLTGGLLLIICGALAVGFSLSAVRCGRGFDRCAGAITLMLTLAFLALLIADLWRF